PRPPHRATHPRASRLPRPRRVERRRRALQPREHPSARRPRHLRPGHAGHERPRAPPLRPRAPPAGPVPPHLGVRRRRAGIEPAAVGAGVSAKAVQRAGSPLQGPRRARSTRRRIMSAGHDDPDERFRALARAAREAVFIHEDGVVREINDAFTRLFGYERDEILGKDGVTTLCSPESRAEGERSMRVPGGSGTREIAVLTKTGEKRIVESAAEPITYHGRAMRVVTMQDMTERHALDAERRRTAALLQAIVDNTNQLVFVKDLHGRMLLGNAAFTGEGTVAGAATSGEP